MAEERSELRMRFLDTPDIDVEQLATEQMRIDDIGVRVVNTRRLRALAHTGVRAGYNRKLGDEFLNRLDPNGKHILAPIQFHHFIDGKPAPEHLRVNVMAKMFGHAAGDPEEHIFDIATDAMQRLTRVVERRRAKPDPTWEHVVELLSEFVEQLKVNPPMIDMTRTSDSGWVAEREDSVYPLEWVRGVEPYYIAGEMQELLEKAADKMVSHQLAPQDLLTPTGFAVLERPFFVDTEAFGEVPIRAILWRPVADGVLVSTLWDMDHEQSPAPSWDVRAYRSRLWPASHWIWPWGETADAPFGWMNADEQNAITIVELRKYVLALWVMSQQRITGVTGMRPVRGLRRRIERLKLPSTVLVVKLRRQEPRAHYEGETTLVEWSHRWIQSGHWRRYWSEKEQRRKLTWVSLCIKGPPDKPLIVKDRIYKFER